MNRIPVDITEKGVPIASIECPSCKSTLPKVATRSFSYIWYCKKCDVNHETTVSGDILRSFKTEQSVTVNILGDNNGTSNSGTDQEESGRTETGRVRFL